MGLTVVEILKSFPATLYMRLKQHSSRHRGFPLGADWESPKVPISAFACGVYIWDPPMTGADRKRLIPE